MFTDEYFSDRVSARTGGGRGSAKCRQLQTGGGGIKITKNVRTSFMDGPLSVAYLAVANLVQLGISVLC